MHKMFGKFQRTIKILGTKRRKDMTLFDIVETIVFLATIASMAFYTYKAGQASAFIQVMELKYKEKEKENE